MKYFCGKDFGQSLIEMYLVFQQIDIGHCFPEYHSDCLSVLSYIVAMMARYQFAIAAPCQ